ncbi:site-specific DNA-methyltransferase [Clostridium sp. CF011]|uniref:DNA methyltransferase n=1 Tax=Clostridium sp. CF011 TaxID=2843318 RepID=UPI001C0C1FE0|nr:DNA methyltransferase [Clostridium sp. CF011]MBU3092190.1 site-specific DNA-methyltransferase [Clostridium sp. CF011]
MLKLFTNFDKNAIVLDFFSGSSTTAHAAMQLNSEEAGNRKFIMVQLPESTDEKSEAYKAGYKNICEIGKERIRRAGEKILKENKDKEGIENLDIGFKVFKLDSSNIKKWNVDGENIEISIDNMIDNFVPNRTEEDIVYEIMLKYGIDLTYPVEMRNIADKKVFSIGFGALFICIGDEITLEVVEGIVKFKEELNPEITRVVFKDNGFKNDSVKTNAIHILRRNNIQEIMSI